MAAAKLSDVHGKLLEGGIQMNALVLPLPFLQHGCAASIP